MAKRRQRPRIQSHPEVTEIKWNRDLDGNVPVQVSEKMEALSIEHTDVRRQLAVLRATRGQRDVGTLKVPGHLRVDAGMVLDDVDRQTGNRVHRSNAPAEE